jgi:hypothetical protein
MGDVGQVCIAHTTSLPQHLRSRSPHRRSTAPLNHTVPNTPSDH